MLIYKKINDELSIFLQNSSQHLVNKGTLKLITFLRLAGGASLPDVVSDLLACKRLTSDRSRSNIRPAFLNHLNFGRLLRLVFFVSALLLVCNWFHNWLQDSSRLLWLLCFLRSLLLLHRRDVAPDAVVHVAHLHIQWNDAVLLKICRKNQLEALKREIMSYQALDRRWLCSPLRTNADEVREVL